MEKCYCKIGHICERVCVCISLPCSPPTWHSDGKDLLTRDLCHLSIRRAGSLSVRGKRFLWQRSVSWAPVAEAQPATRGAQAPGSLPCTLLVTVIHRGGFHPLVLHLFKCQPGFNLVAFSFSRILLCSARDELQAVQGNGVQPPHIPQLTDLNAAPPGFACFLSVYFFF